MLVQFLPASLMFLLTALFVGLFFSPAVKFSYNNNVTNFYWGGLWAFLGLIAALSGANQTLLMLHYDAEAVSQPILNASVMGFVGFIVIAWCHLCFGTIRGGYRRIRAKINT